MSLLVEVQSKSKPVSIRSGSTRDLAAALSLANLCYLRVWSELLTYTRSDTYLMKAPPGPAAYLAVMCNVLLLGGCLWALAIMARRWLPRTLRAGEIGFLILLIVPLNGLRSVLADHYAYLKSPLLDLIGARGVMLLAAGLAMAGVVALIFFHRRLTHLASTVLVALFPFCALTFGQALWKISRYDAAGFASKPAAPLLATVNPWRVLWFVCDEWDYRLSFIDRDPKLQLPEIDRLRQESIFAVNAYPPGPETPISIPGYYTGRLVERVRYNGPSDLEVRYRGAAAAVPWGSQPNYFERARQLGVNTALIEWFHPTCRVLDGLTFCEWWELGMQHNSMGARFRELLPNQTRSLFETNLLSLFGQSLPAKQHIRTYNAIVQEGIRVAQDPRYGFTIVHLPIPHAPFVFDRRNGQFTLRNSPIRGYLDHLALLDRTIGQIRRALESSGVWDKTTIVFTSDHSYREAALLDGKSDRRIPYLVKMAGQSQGAVYSQPFNTVLTGDLLLATLRGQMQTPDAAIRWLDQNRSRFTIN